MYSDVVVIIPARIGSSRLSGKVLAKIDDKSILEHMLARLDVLNLTNLYVATDAKEIFDIVMAKGYRALLTSKDCSSGSDRVYEALKQIPNADNIKFVVNVQADMPFIDVDIIGSMINYLKSSNFNIVTPVVKVSKEFADTPSNVKVVFDKNGKALYFSRSLIPHGGKEFFYHVGIYGFKVEALEHFVSLEKSQYEKEESLEQLRAIENGISIGVFETEQIPISVDTAEDLDKAKQYYKHELRIR